MCDFSSVEGTAIAILRTKNANQINKPEKKSLAKGGFSRVTRTKNR